MRLRRFCEGQNAANFPQISKLFEGTNAERLNLLRDWPKNGEDASKLEMQLKFEKEVENEEKGTEKLLTVAGMRKHGVSESLVCIIYFCFLLKFSFA